MVTKLFHLAMREVGQMRGKPVLVQLKPEHYSPRLGHYVSPTVKNLQTGTNTYFTEFLNEFYKNIVLGSGNRMSKIFGVGSKIVTHKTNGVIDKISVYNKNGDLRCALTPKAFEEYVKGLKELFSKQAV